jgi:hypothetical protein
MACKNQLLTTLFALAAVCLGHAQTATNIIGLYYTGMLASGALAPQGAADLNMWKVTYASTNGGNNENTTYEGAAYVVSTAYIAADHVKNTANAQWITAPNAGDTNGANKNIGNDNLPGIGTGAGSNEGIYVYTLAFQIAGNGKPGTISTSQISISLTIAADDQFAIYVNPGTSGASQTMPTGQPTGTPAATATVITPYVNNGTEPWQNTIADTLTNFGGTNNAGNSTFVIGTNYISVVVDNTYSMTGQQNQTWNPSGLLVYQVGSAMTIDGKPIASVVPEVGAWIPVVGALGLLVWRRKRTVAAA